jgi:hypothetical protein
MTNCIYNCFTKSYIWYIRNFFPLYIFNYVLNISMPFYEDKCIVYVFYNIFAKIFFIKYIEFFVTYGVELISLILSSCSAGGITCPCAFWYLGSLS